jgi:hypothetical protein
MATTITVHLTTDDLQHRLRVFAVIFRAIAQLEPDGVIEVRADGEIPSRFRDGWCSAYDEDTNTWSDWA